MKRALLSVLALLAVSTIPASAVPVIDVSGNFSYSLGKIQIGQTREVALYFGEFSSGFIPLLPDNTTVTSNGAVSGYVYRIENLYTLFGFTGYDKAFSEIPVDCGRRGVCVGLRVTPRVDDPLVGGRGELAFHINFERTCF
jgi:hypothetical protein